MVFNPPPPPPPPLSVVQVAIANPEDVAEPDVKVRPELASTIDAVIATAPKKPHWDLKRDVDKKLEKLERRTQRAVFELAQEEEARRFREAGGVADTPEA